MLKSIKVRDYMTMHGHAEDCAELRELARELAPAPAWMTSED